MGPRSYAFRENETGDVKPLTKRFVSAKLKILGKRHGIDGRARTHSLRKGGMTSLYSSGISHTKTLIQGRLSIGTADHYIKQQPSVVRDMHIKVADWATDSFIKDTNRKNYHLALPL